MKDYVTLSDQQLNSVPKSDVERAGMPWELDESCQVNSTFLFNKNIRAEFHPYLRKVFYLQGSPNEIMEKKD